MPIRNKSIVHQRPPAGAQINWGHQLASGLVGCFLCNESGGSVVRDLVDNREYTIVGGVWVPGNSGGSLAVGGADNSLWLQTDGNNTGTSGTIPDRLKITPNLTIHWRGILLGNPSASAGIAGVSFASTLTAPWNGYSIRADGIGVVIAAFSKDGAFNYYTICSAGAVPKNKATSLSFTTRVGLQVTYADGRVGTTNTYSYTAITYGASPQLNIGSAEPGINNRDAHSVNSEFLIYNRALSAAEIWALHNEPYGFLTQTAIRKWFI